MWVRSELINSAIVLKEKVENHSKLAQRRYKMRHDHHFPSAPIFIKMTTYFSTYCFFQLGCKMVCCGRLQKSIALQEWPLSTSKRHSWQYREYLKSQFGESRFLPPTLLSVTTGPYCDQKPISHKQEGPTEAETKFERIGTKTRVLLGKGVLSTKI